MLRNIDFILIIFRIRMGREKFVVWTCAVFFSSLAKFSIDFFVKKIIPPQRHNIWRLIEYTECNVTFNNFN